MRSVLGVLTSGRWSGFYKQGGRRYPQHMTLEFSDGLVRGDGSDDLGPFTIDGEYRADDGGELRVGWIKTYEGAHSVLYLGRLDDDCIVGTWRIPPWAADGFEIRPELVPAPTR
jgi:hypothetical protein